MIITDENYKLLLSIYKYLNSDPKNYLDFNDMKKHFVEKGFDADILHTELQNIEQCGHIAQAGNSFGLLSKGRAYIKGGGVDEEYKEIRKNKEKLAILDKLNIKVLKFTIPLNIITIIISLAALGISIWAINKM